MQIKTRPGYASPLSAPRKRTTEKAEQTTSQEASETRTTTTRRERPVRAAISGRRNVLTVSGMEKGYKYRWVNDVDDRVAALREIGYEPVQHAVRVGDASTQSVTQTVTKRVGGGVSAVLMRIPEDWHTEDHAAKQRAVDEAEAAIKDAGSREGNYIPKHSKIEIEHK